MNRTLWLLLALTSLGHALLSSAQAAELPYQSTPPGWYGTIYLTQQRQCTPCRMHSLPNGQLWLENKAGIGIAVGTHEVLGINSLPVERKLLHHWARHLNPVVAKTQFPQQAAEYWP
jgi:hypothetical protein